MIGREFRFHDGQKGAALAIRIILGGAQDRIKKVLNDGTVVVELTGDLDHPRKYLLEFLADTLDVELENIDIIEGREGTELLLSILDVSPEDIQRRILDKTL